MEWIRHTSWDGRMERVMALYHTSFPINEQRTDADHKAALEDERFYCLSAWEGEDFLGLLFCWKMKELFYVEHFAVNTQMRGSGIGSRLLADFCKDKPLVLLEIDPPQDEISQRRLRFYERLGFVQNPYPHRHPPYRRGFEAHPLRVMTWPRATSRQEYDGFFDELRNSAMQYAQK